LVFVKAIGRRAKPFAPSVNKGSQFDVPDGIFAHPTQECGGNVHSRRAVTSGSFKKETKGANPHREKNAADSETSSCLQSAYRIEEEDIQMEFSPYLFCIEKSASCSQKQGFSPAQIVTARHCFKKSDDYVKKVG
jgi:hypothetical protein